MIRLPKIERDHKKTEGLCKCRPICKSRRREWKGKVLATSAELLLERKPVPECFKTWPMKVSPNTPCPLQNRRLIIKEKYAAHVPRIVRICQAPIDVSVDAPYLRYAQMAVRLGAHRAVDGCCPFCKCGACCPCSHHDYQLDAENTTQRRYDMRVFDTRVKTDYQIMRIMYDKN